MKWKQVLVLLWQPLCFHFFCTAIIKFSDIIIFLPLMNLIEVNKAIKAAEHSNHQHNVYEYKIYERTLTYLKNLKQSSPKGKNIILIPQYKQWKHQQCFRIHLSIFFVYTLRHFESLAAILVDCTNYFGCLRQNSCISLLLHS